MRQTYPPLLFLNTKLPDGVEVQKEILRASGVSVDDWTKEDLIRYYLSDLFMMPDNLIRAVRTKGVVGKLRQKLTEMGYQKNTDRVNAILRENDETIRRYMQCNRVYKHFMQHVLEERYSVDQISNLDLRAECRDMTLSGILLEEWTQLKQVYKPDRDFAKALVGTQRLEISKSMFEHLPCRNFYVDLSDCSEFCAPVVGAFVFVNTYPEKGIVSCYLLTEQMLTFSYYGRGYYDDNGIAEFDFSDSSIVSYDVGDKNYLDRYGYLDKSVFRMDRKTIYLLLMQLVCYLSLDEPQITESELTKSTYRPRSAGSQVRNKWSEVHIEDVGVRYGTKFRKEYKRILTERTEIHHRTHRSPKPHFRSAHWAKYWTGKGRTIPKMNWIEPVFVGFGDDTKDIVIHEVGKEVGKNDQMEKD